jgi:hypothetical protein
MTDERYQIRQKPDNAAMQVIATTATAEGVYEYLTGVLARAEHTLDSYSVLVGGAGYSARGFLAWYARTRH